jgi:hypothetical protein
MFYHEIRFHVDFVLFHSLFLKIPLTFLHLLRIVLRFVILPSISFVSAYHRSIFHPYLANVYQSLSSEAQVLFCLRSYERFTLVISSICWALFSLTSPKNHHHHHILFYYFLSSVILGFSVLCSLLSVFLVFGFILSVLFYHISTKIVTVTMYLHTHSYIPPLRNVLHVVYLLFHRSFSLSFSFSFYRTFVLEEGNVLARWAI